MPYSVSSSTARSAPLSDPQPQQLDVRFSNPQLSDDQKPLAFEDFLKIDLDEIQKSSLATELITQIDAILAARQTEADRVKEYRSMYRQFLAESGMPFPGAFNVNAPITPDKVDTALAETEDIFDASDPHWTVQGPPNEEYKAAVELQQDVLDAYEDLVRESRTSPKVYFDAWLLGTGWEARVFKRKFLDVMERRTWRTAEEFTREFPDDWEQHQDLVTLLNEGKEVTRIVEFRQEVLNAAVSEHVEWEDAIVPLETEGLTGLWDAPLLGRRVWLRHSQVAELERDGDYLPGVAEELKYEKLEKDGVLERGKLNPDYHKTPLETFECIYWMRIPDGVNAAGEKKERLVRCLVNVERQRKLILRVIRYPYFHGRPYLIPYHIQQTEHGLYQPGLGHKLAQLNLTLNALLCHVLNTGLIGTSMSFKVRTNTDAVRALFEKQWYPGSITELSNLDDAQQWELNLPELSPMVNLFASLMTFADSVTGLNAYLGGQADPEDKDAPGNKAALLLKRSSKKLRRYVNCLRESVDESGYQSLRLIYQYVPAKRIAETIGKSEEEVRQQMRIPLPTVTHAIAFDSDRLARQAEDELFAKLLFQEPLIAQFPTRRVKLYRILAESRSSRWRGLMDEVLPNDSELQAMEDAQEGAQQVAGGGGEAALTQVVERARQRAIGLGKSPEEAEAIAQQVKIRAQALLAQRARQQPGRATNGAPQAAGAPA